MRLKIAVSVTALVLVLILGQALALVFMYEEMEEEFIDNILAEQLEYSIRVSGTSEQLALPNTPNMQLYRLRPGESLPVGLPPELAALPVGNHEIYLGKQEYHMAVRDTPGARFILRYDESEHEARIKAVSTVIISGALTLCALVLILVYALAGRLTRGLENLAYRLTQGRGEQAYAQPDMEGELLAVARALDEAELRQRDLLARERDFNAHLSHELRTPLTGIRTDAELLASQEELPDAARRRATRIMAASDRITSLAESLLLLAREARPASQWQEEVDLEQALQQGWQSLTPENTPLALELPPGTLLRADPALLNLVLRNLLDNALKHGAGSPVSCRLQGRRLQVRDQGPGFGATDPEQLFARFARQGPAAGHGLGLALVRHICQACGWQATARNAPEGGALLEVDFGRDITISSQTSH